MSKLPAAFVSGNEAFESWAVSRLLDSLSVVEDPRSKRGVRYSLREILVTAIFGCLCGCDNAEALEDWGHKELRWLRHYLPLENGAPGQDVYLRVLSNIDHETFSKSFSAWTLDLLRFSGLPTQIAIDGQTYRGSKTKSSGEGAVHMLHALACDFGLVLGQQKTEEKSNEITAIPKLLENLVIRGALVSIDSMGCQTSIAKRIVEKQGDYLFGLKGNQSSLHKQTKLLFAEVDKAEAEATANEKNSQASANTLPSISTFIQASGGHGRVDTRVARIVSKEECSESFEKWVPASKRWKDLNCLIEIERVVDTSEGKTETEEKRYYISSAHLSAEEALAATRNHWLVENQLHWCMDVSFKQDAYRGRMKNLAANFGVIRQIAFNIIKNNRSDKLSMPRTRRMCDYSIPYREALIGVRK